ERLARARGEQLGVGEPRRAGLRPEVHDDDTDRHGTGQRAPPDLVHARHEAGAVAEHRALLAEVGTASGGRTPCRRRAARGGAGPSVDRVEGHGSTSGTSANTSPGLRRRPRCDSGHTLTNAVPTTLPIGTNPPPGLPVLYRESAEFCRLSPMTNSMSSGTVRSNSSWLGTEPGLMWVPSIGSPFPFRRPSAPQHTTWSPWTRTRRLMRCSPVSCGSRPTNVSAARTASDTGLSSCGAGGGSQPPGSLNTTTSPRCTSNAPGTSRDTMTRSPSTSVSSMDALGM